MSGYLPLLFIIVMFAGFYFLILRPAQRRQKEAREILTRLSPGQEVMTTAGIYGTLAEVDDDFVLLEVSPGVRVKYAKPAIARIVEAESAAEPTSEPTAADGDAATALDGEKHS